MFATWLGVGQAAALAATVSALLLVANVAAPFAVRRRVVAPAGLEAAMLLALIPLLSPQGWDYVFLIATPAFVYVINYDGDLPPAAPRHHLACPRPDRVQPLRHRWPGGVWAVHGAVDHQRVLPGGSGRTDSTQMAVCSLTVFATSGRQPLVFKATGEGEKGASRLTRRWLGPRAEYATSM